MSENYNPNEVNFNENNTNIEENEIKPETQNAETADFTTADEFSQSDFQYSNADFSEKIASSSGRRVNIPTIVISVLLAAVIGICSSLVTFSYLSSKNDGLAASSDTAQSSQVNITVDETVNSNVEAVAKKVVPSVVGIRTTAAVTNFFGGSSNSTGEGSGVIYTSDGYIITNYHVIESAVESQNSSIEIYLSSDTSTPINATVVGYNISYDLAVVKIDKTDLPAVNIADASKLAVGQYVAAIGAPGGLEYMGSVSYGIISGLNRTVTSSSASNETVRLIQTDAAINPGNSGGALVNLQGELVGINSEKIVSTSYEGMGFAIPIDTVKEVCDKIIAKEYDPDPYIGITISEKWTANRLKAYGYPSGAVVMSVTSGGPAAEAGIQSGDIIVEYNGTAITEYTILNDLISDSKIGEIVSIKIYRSGRYYATTVKVGSNNSQ